MDVPTFKDAQEYLSSVKAVKLLESDLRKAHVAAKALKSKRNSAVDTYEAGKRMLRKHVKAWCSLYLFVNITSMYTHQLDEPFKVTPWFYLKFLKGVMGEECKAEIEGVELCLHECVDAFNEKVKDTPPPSDSGMTIDELGGTSRQSDSIEQLLHLSPADRSDNFFSRSDNFSRAPLDFFS